MRIYYFYDVDEKTYKNGDFRNANYRQIEILFGIGETLVKKYEKADVILIPIQYGPEGTDTYKYIDRFEDRRFVIVDKFEICGISDDEKIQIKRILASKIEEFERINKRQMSRLEILGLTLDIAEAYAFEDEILAEVKTIAKDFY